MFKTERKAVRCYLIKDNKVVITKYKKGNKKEGYYDIPGGKIEEGETSKDALIREIKEELDTEIKVGNLIGTVEYDYTAFHLSMDCFWAQVSAGNLLLREAEAARWLTKRELYDVHWLPADLSVVAAIEDKMEGADEDRE